MPPTSIQFYAFEKADSIPSPSGYCQKLETFFRACPSLATAYKQIDTWPSKAPKGKLPYVVITSSSSSAPVTLADSQFIIRHLIDTQLAPNLDEPLSPAERAESRAFQVWTEELLYPALVCTRVHPSFPHNYARMYEDFPVPWVVKPVVMWMLRRSILKSLTGHGVARHNKEEILSILKEWVQNVSERLAGGKAWFHNGAEPTLVDVVISAFLMHGLAQSYNREFSEMVGKDKVLVRYTMKAVEQWFPEYSLLLEKLRGLLAS